MANTDTLYKRHKNGGFVFWENQFDQQASGQVMVHTLYGNVGSPARVSTKTYMNMAAAHHVVAEIAKKKKNQGLYHTLADMNIKPVNLNANEFVFDDGKVPGSRAYGSLTFCLDRGLPPLGRTAKQPEEPEEEPKINRPIPEDIIRAISFPRLVI